MIKTNKGDVLANVTQGYIIHGCNAHGVMGSGIAKSIKEKWPKVFEKYSEWHTGVTASGLRSLPLGEVQPVLVSNELVIINAITQHNYGKTGNRFVNYGAVAKCFMNIHELCTKTEDAGILEYKSLNFPLIGAGLGGGDWEVIAEIIDEIIPDTVEKNLWIL